MYSSFPQAWNKGKVGVIATDQLAFALCYQDRFFHSCLPKPRLEKCMYCTRFECFCFLGRRKLCHLFVFPWGRMYSAGWLPGVVWWRYDVVCSSVCQPSPEAESCGFQDGSFVVQWRKCVVQELVIDECQLTGCISVCGCSLECDIGIYVEL